MSVSDTRYELDPIAYNDLPELFPNRGPIAGTGEQILFILDGFRRRLVPKECPDIWVREFGAWKETAQIGARYYAMAGPNILMVITRLE